MSVQENKNQEYSGVCKWFNGTKGYGFLVQENGTDIFVHHSGVLGEHKKGLQNLKEGDKVIYNIGDHEKGKMAIDVQVIDEKDPDDSE